MRLFWMLVAAVLATFLAIFASFDCHAASHFKIVKLGEPKVVAKYAECVSGR